MKKNQNIWSFATYKAHSEGSDQNGCVFRPIRVFAGRTVLSCSGSFNCKETDIYQKLQLTMKALSLCSPLKISPTVSHFRSVFDHKFWLLESNFREPGIIFWLLYFPVNFVNLQKYKFSLQLTMSNLLKLLSDSERGQYIQHPKCWGKV